jgi:hypothetical protein
MLNFFFTVTNVAETVIYAIFSGKKINDLINNRLFDFYQVSFVGVAV